MVNTFMHTRLNPAMRLIVTTLILVCISWFSFFAHADEASTVTAVEQGAVLHVDAKQAALTIEENPDIIVLDVRTPIEFKFGRLANAININYYSFSFKSKIAALDRDKTYLVHCQTGVRSGNTLPIMQAAGFSKLIHMDGGYKAWKEAGLPTIK